MNSKKLKTQLLAAVAMTLVAVIALGSSTFAWFAANRTVTADGTSISATVPTQLLIKGSAAAAEYKSQISFNAEADSMRHGTNALTDVVPVAYKGLGETYTGATITTLYKLTADADSLVKGNGYLKGWDGNIGTDTKVTSATFASIEKDGAKLFEAAKANETTGNDYVHDTFTLKMAGTPSIDTDKNKLKAKITMSTTDIADKAASDIYKAVHVVFTSTSTQTGFTAALYDLDMGTGNLTTADGKDTIVAEIGLDAFTAENQEIVYNMYIYYDGEDDNCNNSTAINMGAYAFNIEFSLPDLA